MYTKVPKRKVRSGCFCYCAAHGLVITAQNPKGPRGPCRRPLPPKYTQPLVFPVYVYHPSCCCCSAAQSCLTLCDPMNCSTPDLPVLHQLQSLPKPMSIELMMPSNCLILCRPLLLLPSIFPSIGVFSNESDLCIRWPKYWSFSFNISPSNEHPGLI